MPEVIRELEAKQSLCWSNNRNLKTPAVMALERNDQICFELLTQKSQSWLLRYVKGAVARTDVPDTLVKLVKQRRRWLNGSFFALLLPGALIPAGAELPAR